MRRPEDEYDITDVLLPGFIEACSTRQFGEPCLKGTRIPFSVGLGWVWESLDAPAARKLAFLTREQIIALAAFHAGYKWHQQRARRKAMDDAVENFWRTHVHGAPMAGGMPPLETP